MCTVAGSGITASCVGTVYEDAVVVKAADTVFRPVGAVIGPGNVELAPPAPVRGSIGVEDGRGRCAAAEERESRVPVERELPEERPEDPEESEEDDCPASVDSNGFRGGR